MTSPESERGYDPANLYPLEGWPGQMPPWELQARIRKLFETHKKAYSGAIGVDWAAQAGGVSVILQTDGLLRADIDDVTSSILRPNTGYFWGENYETGELCVVDIDLFFEALRRLRLLQVLDDLASIDPLYNELRTATEAMLWAEGEQGLDSKYLRIGEFYFSMFTGDGDPNLVSVEIPHLNGSDGRCVVRFNAICDSNGDFNREWAERALDLIRRRRILDDLASI